jgi:hypothetical protein
VCNDALGADILLRLDDLSVLVHMCTHNNAEVVTDLKTSCNKVVHVMSILGCVRTACS